MAALKPLKDLETLVIGRLHAFQEQEEGGGNMVANKYGCILKSTFLLLQDCPSTF